MRAPTLRIAAITADRDGICQAQQLEAAGNLTMNGAGVMQDDGSCSFYIGKVKFNPPRPVTIYSGSNLSGVNFTVYGFDRAGTRISETLAGPNAGTVTTTKYFAAILQVSADAAVSSNVEVGWGSTSASPVFPFDVRVNPFNVSLDCRVTGTVDFDVQYTHDNVFARDWNEGAAEWRTHATLDGASGDADGYIAFPVSAVRVVLNEGSTGSVEMVVRQAGV